MKSNENEILLPPGVKSINDLNTKNVVYDNSIRNNNKELNKGKNNENNLNKNSTFNNSNRVGIPKLPDKSSTVNIPKLSDINNNQSSIDGFFEEIDNIDIEKPKNIKPYVRKRNKRDVLKIISKKITPNEQLLKNPIITTLPVNDNKEANKNDVSNDGQDDNNNSNIKLIPQNQMKYLNVDGTMMRTAEENIRNVIKNTHNSNKKNTTYLYNHRDYPARRIKQTSFLFHRVGPGVSDEKAQLSLQTHKRKMEGVQNAIIKKIKESK